jgi:branched-subunit amino acid aminotransferase/4-amino-4-deoxychorismate lyase
MFSVSASKIFVHVPVALKQSRGKLLTPHADYCLPGITRATVIELAHKLAIPFEERRVSLSEFHSADEVLASLGEATAESAQVFTTGTMGELTPVVEIDGRKIGDGVRGSITQKLQVRSSTR